MKLSKKRLLKLIEMAYKGHLGIIDDDDPKKFSETGEVSGGLYSGLGIFGPDYDEWEESKPEGEEWEDVEDRTVSKQRRAAKAYAGSRHFQNQAEKFYGRLEANIWVMTKVGYFSALEKKPDVTDASFIDFREDGWDHHRTLYFNLDEKAITFLKAVANTGEIKSNIDNISPDDTVIFFSTDAVGNKEFLLKNTPWVLFHAILHDDNTMGELMSDGYFGRYFTAPKTRYHTFSKPVNQILTMKAARDQDAYMRKYNTFDEEFNYLTEDDYAEMIVQELLGKRGLVLNTSGLSEEDLRYLNNIIVPGIKKYAAMMREKIKGKLIVVKGTG
tara:strand:- start:1287 stop:2273 length:987 start_codon:yes stop_codon:yes gene_type:complete